MASAGWCGHAACGSGSGVGLKGKDAMIWLATASPPASPCEVWLMGEGMPCSREDFKDLWRLWRASPREPGPRVRAGLWLWVVHWGFWLVLRTGALQLCGWSPWVVGTGAGVWTLHESSLPPPPGFRGFWRVQVVHVSSAATMFQGSGFRASTQSWLRMAPSSRAISRRSPQVVLGPSQAPGSGVKPSRWAQSPYSQNPNSLDRGASLVHGHVQAVLRSSRWIQSRCSTPRP